MRDALKDQPEPQVPHDPSLPLDRRRARSSTHWKDYPGPVRLQLQILGGAHVFDDRSRPSSSRCCENLAPGRQTWLTVRNDDIYTFRLGDPAYARDYILHMPGPDKMAGFYMGPDGYFWGREFLGPRTRIAAPAGDGEAVVSASCSGDG